MAIIAYSKYFRAISLVCEYYKTTVVCEVYNR